MTGRDHGGDISQAMRAYGGAAEDWIDLSTGINRVPWPAPAPGSAALRPLPGALLRAPLIAAAQAAFATDWPLLPLAGAQAAIQALPALAAAGAARIVTPTYNEFAPALARAGWQVAPVADTEHLAGADLAILVNPNNPDGRRCNPDMLRALAGRVGLLVVDESFADPHPELSLLPGAMPSNLVVLRSFGKFYGLAGLRLGFACGPQALLDEIAAVSGPWPVSGPALEAGALAYADTAWRERTIARLAAEALRIDALARAAGWTPVGGTALFRLYDTPDAAAAQDRLARHRIWSRRFPYSGTWLRLGLPGDADEWARLEEALA